MLLTRTARCQQPAHKVYFVADDEARLALAGDGRLDGGRTAGRRDALRSQRVTQARDALSKLTHT